MLHVLFTPEGIPGWIGDQPREGSEPVEGLTIEFMAGHRRHVLQWRIDGAREVRLRPSPFPRDPYGHFCLYVAP